MITLQKVLTFWQPAWHRST